LSKKEYSHEVWCDEKRHNISANTLDELLSLLSYVGAAGQDITITIPHEHKTARGFIDGREVVIPGNS
jgi:hypothetical protein